MFTPVSCIDEVVCHEHEEIQKCDTNQEDSDAWCRRGIREKSYQCQIDNDKYTEEDMIGTRDTSVHEVILADSE